MMTDCPHTWKMRQWHEQAVYKRRNLMTDNLLGGKTIYHVIKKIRVNEAMRYDVSVVQSGNDFLIITLNIDVYGGT